MVEYNSDFETFTGDCDISGVREWSGMEKRKSASWSKCKKLS